MTYKDENLLRLLQKNDPVAHPAHYTDGKIEVIDFIEDKGLGFHLGNAIKYIARCKRKFNGENKIEDLRKAIWYLNRQIALWERKESKNGEDK